MLSHFRLTDPGRRPPAHRYEDCDFIVFSSVAAACAGVAEPAATVVDATPMACCRLALMVESRGSELVDVLLMSCWRFDCWTEPLTSGTVDLGLPVRSERLRDRGLRRCLRTRPESRPRPARRRRPKAGPAVVGPVIPAMCTPFCPSRENRAWHAREGMSSPPETA